MPRTTMTPTTTPVRRVASSRVGQVVFFNSTMVSWMKLRVFCTLTSPLPGTLGPAVFCVMAYLAVLLIAVCVRRMARTYLHGRRKAGFRAYGLSASISVKEENREPHGATFRL